MHEEPLSAPPSVTPAGYLGPSSAPRIPTWLTAWSLVGLGAGIAVGVAGHLGWAPWASPLGSVVDPVGRLWINALQMVVVPLVITQLLSAIAGGDGGSSLSGLGARALGLFVALLAAAGVATLLVTPTLLAPLRVSPEAVAALRAHVVIPEAAQQAVAAPSASLGDWLVGLIPRNPFAAAVSGDLLPLIVFTVLFAMAVTQLSEPQRRPLTALFRASAAAMMQLVTWILLGTPLAVFAIILGLALETGVGAAGMLGAYVLLLSGLLLAATGLLYPLTVVLGRVSPMRFARGAAPAQMVALSTRSSLASLPALIEGGHRSLGLPAESTGFVLPLAASTFKLNQTISSTFKFLFLAHVFGIPLSVGQMASFLLLIMILSFSVLGIPRGGGAFRSLPAYIAAGIPVEGVVVIEAVKTIPDIFMTLLNSTAYLSVATLLSRRHRLRRPSSRAAPAPVASPVRAAGESM